MSLESTNPALAAQRNDPSFDSLWQELNWRGLVQVSTDADALEAALTGEPIVYYCGFDPTAASLHLGHLVQLLTMRRIQLAGHKPLALVGGSTGLIGDPRPSSERMLNTPEVVSGWVDSLQSQIKNYISFDGDSAATMVNNLDWTQGISTIEFLRDIGKYFRVGTMIKKDIVAKRLNSETGISYTEFSYQVLQGFDYLQLFRQYNCTLQFGGSDQWGNLTSGTELVRRAEGATVHALGTPLITNSDGTKFGKSEGNAIWLDAELCSPYAFYQFWLNQSDADVIDRLKVFTFRTREEIAELERSVQEAPFKREAQRALAWDVTSLVHGEDATKKVIEASGAIFGKGELDLIDEPTLHAVASELPHASIPAEEATAVRLLVDTGLVKSNGEARRAINDGGAYVNNEKITDPDALVTEAMWLHEKFLLVRRGKKNLALVHRG
ncbi:tyrosine--tRNA ligase [Nesterenkonia sp. E16_7]|uniref:tyrosine--tRNA ligase n=1 Tax=unclassified Nesterenkonia TaxID=2629769 RepID=UPI001A90F9CD|nr:MULTISPECIES: tyrosine--tRNA ligase [unclassified Nesterenkonia]MBO0594779.1 tyrosine--tRNA ligase [Nesterenkonia sp. E16_10]MBO0597028.1 tyrosine--tRNA ligase [Nesterenkonia sp. E16_7]